MMPPEGCTTSAVSPATLRTTGGSTRGADVGAGVAVSAAGAPGFESSGLRHMFSPNRKLRSYKAGVSAEQPGEDGNLRTIVRREGGARTRQTLRVSNQVREGQSKCYMAPLNGTVAIRMDAQNHECTLVSGSRLAPQLPSRNQVARQFGHEKLLPLARFPPARRIKFGIARAAYAKAHA